MTKRIIAIVVLILLLILAVYFSDIFTKEEPATMNEEVAEEEMMEMLEVKHQYIDGKHIFVGTVELPTPCNSFNASVENSDKEGEEILKIEIGPSEEGEACAQVVQEMTYKVIHPGSKDTTFRAFINDKEYRLNIFEIPEHIDIDQYQIYLKG